MREVSINKGKQNKLLNFLFIGICAIVLSGCGSEVEVLEPDDIKVDMQESQAGMDATSEPMADSTEIPNMESAGNSTLVPSVPTEEPTVAPTANPTEEPTKKSEIESTTPDDYYKAATNKTAQEVENFARLVRETLLAKDFEKMSELVAYPITIGGERIESREEFLNMDYASKVNPEFLKKVEEASCEQMFCNWQGVMLGEIGSVWIAEVLDGDLSSMGLKVIGLNDLVDPASMVSTEEIAETREAYKQALLTILNELKLPDGTELYYDGYDEFSQNKFAIHDVDGDGREELILSYVTSSMAGMGKYVFGYNPMSDTVYQQAVAFSMVFYDNGVIKADASHNHGRGEKLWPYTVYYYSAPTDDYRYGVHVDSWEKAYYGESAQGAMFPTETDTDGDGIVYYMMPYDDYSYESPIDGAEYQDWYERQFGAAEIIKLTYYAMTKENIEGVGKENGAEAPRSVQIEKIEEFLGHYVDRQGTEDIYSELQLTMKSDGTYEAIVGLYRLTTLEGPVTMEGDVLVLEVPEMGLRGEISVKDGQAFLTITDSSFEYINKGDVFTFPEKL